MRQYELAIRIAQVHHLVDERKYKKALAVIQTLDMRQVRSLSDLKAFAEVYTKTEQYEAAKATYLRIYRRSRTRRVLYRLIYLSIRTNALDDAEAYYQEFVRMNPNTRDALILRYRIDKAAGVPIGKLIEILQELKQEEYIEEWAYELAKLYHRAGRREECLEECEDILLWFGTGEIVERAKILIDHLQERDPIPYYDDKDFTVPREEEPNPDDTGSLPDINEFIKERKAHKKEERLAEKAALKAEESMQEFKEDYEEESVVSAFAKEKQEEAEPIDKEDKWDEEEELEPFSINQKQETEQKKKEKAVSRESVKKENSNTFIDDYEEDDFEQDGIDLSQKAKDGIQKLSGLLKLGKKEEEKPAEKILEELLQSEKVEKPERSMEKEAGKRPVEYVPHSQSGTGITQNLAKEISAIYEMEHREQLKEKAVTVINEVPNLATSVVDRMTQAIQKSAGKGYIPLDIEEIQGKKDETVTENQMQKEIPEPIAEPEEEQEEQKDSLTKALDEELEKYYEEKAKESACVREELKLEEEEAEPAKEAEAVFEEASKSEAELLKDLLEEEIQDPEIEESEAAVGLESEEVIPDYVVEESCEEEQEAAMLNEDTEVENQQPEEEPVTEKEAAESMEEDETESMETENDAPKEEVSGNTTSPLENYHAPEIPVVQTDYMEMPEITYEDLPTTRALQQSFQNVLRLIEGELDPSHFVLMGDGTERIIGVSKQIVRIMKETGYLSQGRIAKIHAEQLNKMDLITFRGQLKGNCLLIENAADLLFPTITKIFSIMEEYYGDFVVILADEGATLDQLFRFVPVLARKFKYIIDISRYTKEDYEP